MTASVDDDGWRARFYRLPAPARGFLLLLSVWLLLGAVAAAFVFAVDHPDRRLAHQMQHHGVPALATVTRLDLGDHGTFYYTYRVDGHTYATGDNGVGSEGPVNQVGESIHVLYDSTTPSRSCYCTVADLTRSTRWFSEVVAGLWLASIVSVVVAFGIWNGGKLPRIRRWFRPDREWQLARQRNADRAMFKPGQPAWLSRPVAGSLDSGRSGSSSGRPAATRSGCRNTKRL